MIEDETKNEIAIRYEEMRQNRKMAYRNELKKEGIETFDDFITLGARDPSIISVETRKETTFNAFIFAVIKGRKDPPTPAEEREMEKRKEAYRKELANYGITKFDDIINLGAREPSTIEVEISEVPVPNPGSFFFSIIKR